MCCSWKASYFRVLVRGAWAAVAASQKWWDWKKISICAEQIHRHCSTVWAPKLLEWRGAYCCSLTFVQSWAWQVVQDACVDSMGAVFQSQKIFKYSFFSCCYCWLVCFNLFSFLFLFFFPLLENRWVTLWRFFSDCKDFKDIENGR